MEQGPSQLNFILSLFLESLWLQEVTGFWVSLVPWGVISPKRELSSVRVDQHGHLLPSQSTLHRQPQPYIEVGLPISPLRVNYCQVVILSRLNSNYIHCQVALLRNILAACTFVPQQQFELLKITTPLCQDVPLQTRNFVHTDILHAYRVIQPPYLVDTPQNKPPQPCSLVPFLSVMSLFNPLSFTLAYHSLHTQLWSFSYSQTLCSCCLLTTRKCVPLLDLLLCARRNGLPPYTRYFALWMQVLPRKKHLFMRLCCTCGLSESYNSDMISRDGCGQWSHFRCMHVQTPPSETWFCSDCIWFHYFSLLCLCNFVVASLLE